MKFGTGITSRLYVIIVIISGQEQPIFTFHIFDRFG